MKSLLNKLTQSSKSKSSSLLKSTNSSYSRALSHPVRGFSSNEVALTPEQIAVQVLQSQRQDAIRMPADIPRGKDRLAYNYKVGDKIHGFQLEKIDKIEFFEICAYTLTHEKTGAKWLHLDSADMDNVFSTMFRTPPDDHTGKPHILEHLALCGSRVYPVRDPFMNMIKRSLNTYMNAWTGSDFTMYPFSSQNAQDFRNLMSVYTDAAFFPALDYLDFRQEGHRLEFKETEDPSSGLEYKGVVYNEMKGAMSNPGDAFLHRMSENLFKKAQYKFNSGGEPRDIPDLTYEELKAFHKEYYHPSNCQFFSYGDLDFAKHLEFVENEVLEPNFDRNDTVKQNSELLCEDKLDSSLHKEENFMPDLMSPVDKQCKLGLFFLLDLDPVKDSYESFCIRVLENIILEGPNAPFYKAIIEAGKAPSFCPGTGFDHTTRQPTFTLGVEGVSVEDFKECEQVIFDTLLKISKEGVSAEMFEQTMHQYEFQAKKTKSNTGLMYISAMVSPALHGGDPLDVFKINEFSERIRADFESGELFEGLIKKHLFLNPHYLRMYYTPDPKKADREEAKEIQNLKALDSALSPSEKQLIIEEAKALKAHQEQLQDFQVLPTLYLGDIPRHVPGTESETRHISNNKVKMHLFDQPTNGICYLRIKADLSKVPEHLRLFVPMFAEFFGSIGTKHDKYDLFDNKLNTCSSGLSVQIDKYSDSPTFDDIMDRKEQLILSTGFLERNIDQALDLITDLLATPNFDEAQNISDLIKMQAVGKANNIGNKGLQYARSYGASGIRASARSFETLRGDIFTCQYAAEVLKTAQPLPLLKGAIVRMSEIASYVFTEENMEFAVHGNSKKFDLIQMKLDLLCNTIKNNNSRYSEPSSKVDSEFSDQIYYKNFFKTPLQVNMCAETMMGPCSSNQEDYASLLVMQELLTMNFLLPYVREQGGAYGAGCSVDGSGLISLYSYRDPNVDATYDQFERAVAELIEGKFGEREMVEAKLMAFQKLDKNLEPSLRGLGRFTRGSTDEQKAKLRLLALDASKEDICFSAQRYLMDPIEHDRTSRVVFGSQQANFDLLSGNGWSIQNPIDFLSHTYFEEYNKKTGGNE